MTKGSRLSAAQQESGGGTLASPAEQRDQIPTIFDLTELARWFASRGKPVTRGELERAGGLVGRDQYPALVHFLQVYRLLSGEALSFGTSAAWSSAEHPLQHLRQVDWLDLFERAGYTVDGVSAARPRDPTRLYRGCRFEHRRRWSWTPDPELARWFADRVRGDVFTVDAPPSSLLATFTAESDTFRGEAEVVIQPKGLKIHPVIG